MPTALATLKDASKYFALLPAQLEDYFDDAYQRAFDQIMQSLDQFFAIVSTVDQQANENQIINPNEATDIGEHGFTLLLKLIDLMEKLDLPHKRKEIEQVSIIFARWVIRYDGQLNHIEPIVNALALAANNMQDKEALIALSELMSMVVNSCSSSIKHDLDSSDIYRPWRLLHINRGIVATRTHDISTIRKVFDEITYYLPQESEEFFKDALTEMDSPDYPAKVQKVILQYISQQPKIRLH